MTKPEPEQGQIHRYALKEQLGEGAFGLVRAAEDLVTHEKVAVKFLKRSCFNKYVEGELRNHGSLEHPHIIELKEVFLTDDHVCLVMEYANGGALFEYVKKQRRLKEGIARWFFQQLILGLDYCHKRGVVNRDMKLENTLLQYVDGLPLPLAKICDFGYSRGDALSAAQSKVGTVTYMAPEVLSAAGKYNAKQADVWSCGVMLYAMLYGRYPFYVSTQKKVSKASEMLLLLNMMRNKEYEIPADIPVSSECKELLKKLLEPNPKTRINVAEILQDRWFQSNLPADALTMNERCLEADVSSTPRETKKLDRLLRQLKQDKQDKQTLAGA